MVSINLIDVTRTLKRWRQKANYYSQGWCKYPTPPSWSIGGFDFVDEPGGLSACSGSANMLWQYMLVPGMSI